jgi:hypothetical protein
MPPTKAKASKGTQLKRGDGGGSEVFTKVGELISVSGPGSTMATADATSHDSTAAEYIATILDEGEVTLEYNLVGPDAQQQGLRTDQVNGTLRNFQLVFTSTHATTPTTAAFAALVTNIAPTAPAPSGGKLTGSATLKISGLVTWTYAPT